MVNAMKSPFLDSFAPTTVLVTHTAAVETELKSVVRTKESRRPILSATKPTATLPMALQALLNAVKCEPSESL